MNDHERMHVDNLVHEAVDLLCETSIQRCAGPGNALRQLRDDPNGEGIWLDRFVTMFLGEHALDNEAGACAILEAFARRPMPEVHEATVGATLKRTASLVFSDLVRAKADEALERASTYEGAVS